MDYTLSYRSSRSEVWRFYWAAWRARLWPVHLVLAAVLAFLLTDVLAPLAISSYVLYFFGFLPAVTLFFALWPQLMFKGGERTLLVGPDGWSTMIGSKSGSRRWAEVASIREAKGSVVITSATGNALIVPARAFVDEAFKSRFVKDAQAWHRAHAA
jgi:hypothetical protein